MAELKHPYVSVRKDGVDSYGGNQRWLDRNYMKRSACGLIACTDLLLYLHRNRPGCPVALFGDDTGEDPVPMDRYQRWVELVQKKYLPVIPNVGTIGVEVAVALNRCFKANGIPLHASWAVRKERLWNSIEAMLENDIPVILAVGANFPLPVKLHKLPFYREGRPDPACSTCAHFVTVTGIDGQRLRISSWGREYYIQRQEFWDYVRRYSTFFLSSILRIWPE